MIYPGENNKKSDLTMHAKIGLCHCRREGEGVMVGNSRVFMDNWRSSICNREVVLHDLHIPKLSREFIQPRTRESTNI